MVSQTTLANRQWLLQDDLTPCKCCEVVPFRREIHVRIAVPSSKAPFCLSSDAHPTTLEGQATDGVDNTAMVTIAMLTIVKSFPSRINCYGRGSCELAKTDSGDSE
jgi:hypothetical protein